MVPAVVLLLAIKGPTDFVQRTDFMQKTDSVQKSKNVRNPSFARNPSFERNPSFLKLKFFDQKEDLVDLDPFSLGFARPPFSIFFQISLLSSNDYEIYLKIVNLADNEAIE